MIELMPADFDWNSGDLVKFITVYNGAIVTPADDESSYLRFTLASYLIAAIRFNQAILLKGQLLESVGTSELSERNQYTVLSEGMTVHIKHQTLQLYK